MYDFHIHSIFSDGVLIPAEIARRYLVKGFEAIAITDHCDASNIGQVILSIRKFISSLPFDYPMKVFSGVELTHIQPSQINSLVREARELGADIVVVHGESIVEPVAPGTNMAAIEAGADILAHPGFLTEEEASLAKEKGVLLEISTRAGHSYANGWVINIAQKTGAGLIVNNDAHGPSDILDYDFMVKIAEAGGLENAERVLKENAQKLLRKISSAS